VVTVTRLDRAARYLLNTLTAITRKEVGFRSLADAWADTTTAPGHTVCHQAAIHPRRGAARASEITGVVLSRGSAS
jgi:DNA invertase Pin-like site-specific DNA recombinase